MITEGSLFHFSNEEKNLIAVLLLSSIKDRYFSIMNYSIDEWEKKQLFNDMRNEINDQTEETGLVFVTSKEIYLANARPCRCF